MPASGILLRKNTSKYLTNYKISTKIQENAKNAMETFNHKEIEETVEQAVVLFMYKYKDYFK